MKCDLAHRLALRVLIENELLAPLSVHPIRIISEPISTILAINQTSNRRLELRQRIPISVDTRDYCQ